MIHLTMNELERLGFEVVKSYEHDNFITQRRKKGCITVETTFEMPSGKFASQDLTIDEKWIEGFTANELVWLDNILNKKR